MTASRTTPSHARISRIDGSRIESAKDGQEWAWEEIYTDLVGPVTGYLRTRGAADPADLSSEVFFQVARDIHRFEGDETKFRSWVFVIAHRRLIDARRASARQPNVVNEPIDGQDAKGGDVEAEVMEALSTDWIEETLGTLTEDQRDVIALRVISDLSLKEAASVLGRRVGAVKGLQRRALQTLRAQLEPGGVSQ